MSARSVSQMADTFHSAFLWLKIAPVYGLSLIHIQEKDERKVIYYVTDKLQQGQYIKMFKEQNMDAVILDHNIDTSFISQLEQRNEHYKQIGRAHV